MELHEVQLRQVYGTLLLQVRFDLAKQRMPLKFIQNLKHYLDFDAINNCLTETNNQTNTVNRILAKGYKASKSSYQLQNYDCAIRISQNLDLLEMEFLQAIDALTGVQVKCIIPREAFQKELYQRSQKLVQLQQIRQRQICVDVRIVKYFRIWQREVLDVYWVEMQKNMNESVRGILKARLRLVAKKLQSNLRRSFNKWIVFSQ